MTEIYHLECVKQSGDVCNILDDGVTIEFI